MENQKLLETTLTAQVTTLAFLLKEKYHGSGTEALIGGDYLCMALTQIRKNEPRVLELLRLNLVPPRPSPA